MANIFLMGSAGSGKTIYIKKRILDNLKNGKPSIFINFRQGICDFSKNIIKDSLIINANSFTQISKIKNKEYNDLVIFNFTENYTDLSIKIKEKVLLEILKNENWFNHDIFIDDAYYLTNYEQMYRLSRKDDRNIFYSIMRKHDLNIGDSDNIVYFKIFGENIDVKLYNYLHDFEQYVVKYVEYFNNKYTFSKIDCRRYSELVDLSHNEKIEFILNKI